mmetsp:Transcript_31542/g.57980  ORF Transcript_31542/g.57980 Transcript_31542/m.57980 type:complete len:208 (-) Transcript_31542:98-721(-)
MVYYARTEFVIVTETLLLLFLQFGEKIMPSNFAARKICHAGSGALMLLLDPQDPMARWFVYTLSITSIALTWNVLPKWVPQFRFGEMYDAGITIYLMIVHTWFFMRMPPRALAPLFFADPAGAVVGKFFSRRNMNYAWYGKKTVMGSLAVWFFAFISMDIPGAVARAILSVFCALAEAYGGTRFDNAAISVIVLGSWLWYHQGSIES